MIFEHIDIFNFHFAWEWHFLGGGILDNFGFFFQNQHYCSLLLIGIEPLPETQME